MKITYMNNKLYLVPNVEERRTFIPYIPAIKMDKVTGKLIAPTQTLIVILSVFPRENIEPTDKITADLIKQGDKLLTEMAGYKSLAVDSGKEVKLNQYPFLMKHQAVCNVLSTVRNRYAYFLDTGTR